MVSADFNGDGLLDLILCERYYGAVTHGPALLRNKGDFKFDNVSADSGLILSFEQPRERFDVRGKLRAHWFAWRNLSTDN